MKNPYRNNSESILFKTPTKYLVCRGNICKFGTEINVFKANKLLLKKITFSMKIFGSKSQIINMMHLLIRLFIGCYNIKKVPNLHTRIY